MAILIKTDYSVASVRPIKKSFTLDELQKYVGGYIEMIELPSGKTFIVNEEGKLSGLEENVVATQMWKKEFPIEKYSENNDSLVVGDVLVIDNKHELE